MKWGLNERGYNDVLAVGSDLVSASTLGMLCQWADIILLAKKIHGENIYPIYKDKINKHFYIGDDLEISVKKQLDAIGL